MASQTAVQWLVRVLVAIGLSLIVLVTVGIGLAFWYAPVPRKPTGKVPIEFRILADRRRDTVNLSPSPDQGGTGDPPTGYKWVRFDERSGLESDPDAFLRVDPRTGKTFILVRLDRYNVSEKDMSDIYLETDAHLQPAIGFRFKPTGARRFGALTRSHLPEENGEFKYRLAIILDHAVITAPMINSEIREAGIIEGGGKGGFTAHEVDRIITSLTK